MALALRHLDGPIRRVSREEPCPVCRHTDWCGIGDRVVICMRVPSGRNAANGGWVHRRADAVPCARPAVAPTPPAVPVAPVAERDRAYRALLDALPLSADHRRALRARGLSDAWIDRAGYRTLPIRGRAEAARRVARLVPDLAGIPGFIRRDGDRSYWTVAGAAGLLIPSRDADGRIQALRIRADAAPIKGARYRWLSSAHAGGPSPGTPAHVARGAARRGRVWWTEGELKADVIAHLLGDMAIGIAGVACWRAAMPVIPAGADVVLAYDRDLISNHAVAYYAAAAETALREAGHRLHIAQWARGKGVDDALAEGCPIVVHPR